MYLSPSPGAGITDARDWTLVLMFVHQMFCLLSPLPRPSGHMLITHIENIVNRQYWGGKEKNRKEIIDGT